MLRQLELLVSLQRGLVAVLAAAKPRNQTETTNSFHQVRESTAIFLEHCRELQPQSETRLYMAHNRFGPNLAFFDKKMNGGRCAQRLWLARLDEQTAGA